MSKERDFLFFDAYRRIYTIYAIILYTDGSHAFVIKLKRAQSRRRSTRDAVKSSFADACGTGEDERDGAEGSPRTNADSRKHRTWRKRFKTKRTRAFLARIPISDRKMPPRIPISPKRRSFPYSRNLLYILEPS